MVDRLVVVAHNLRSAHNVGALFRTAEGLGVAKLYLTGYTPYPVAPNDTRLPHVAKRAESQINKTALGANEYLAWEHLEQLESLVGQLKEQGFRVVGLEQADSSISLEEFAPSAKLALLIGNEPKGIDSQALDLCDAVVEIPMRGRKESFNVVQAAAIAIYQIMR
jgi:23S rRNA (guanosine2251-2'-O)-methyltransferase